MTFRFASLLQMQTLFWVNAPKQMKTVTYIFLGWAVLPYAGEMRTALGSTVRLPASSTCDCDCDCSNTICVRKF